MTEIPKPGAINEKTGRLGKLADASRGLPQIGPYDPAGVIRQSMDLVKTEKYTRKESTQVPEAIHPTTTKPNRGIIRRIFRR
jgi:hypothetical protein